MRSILKTRSVTIQTNGNHLGVSEVARIYNTPQEMGNNMSVQLLSSPKKVGWFCQDSGPRDTLMCKAFWKLVLTGEIRYWVGQGHGVRYVSNLNNILSGFWWTRNKLGYTLGPGGQTLSKIALRLTSNMSGFGNIVFVAPPKEVTYWICWTARGKHNVKGGLWRI